MKIIFIWSIFAYIFSITIALVPASVDDQSATCVLNFTSYPYQPSGDCIGSETEITGWNSISTTLCCRNALTALTRALAQRASTGKDAIFIDQSLWENCSGPFSRQQSVSAQSCHLDNLFYENSGHCASLSLSEIRKKDTYQNALKNCSNFGSSFDENCKSCTEGIIDARDELLVQNQMHGNDTEKAICGVAVVISIAAEKFDDQFFIDDFYRCLPALDVLDPGYFKIKDAVAKALLALLIGLAAMTLILFLVKYVTKRTPRKPVQWKESANYSSLYRFSKAEIENAIHFGNESLGRGSAGQVYKGLLPSGQIVAIKHIFKSNKSDSFTREVDGLSRARHPNLVFLFGCCEEDGEQYLVYEYCSGGNLAKHLKRENSVLSWKTRVKILRDCAFALRYLHHHRDGCIVHRDIKLTNILLTDDLDPKLSDFGLAKMLGMEESKVFTDVRGTIGYMDPEYMGNSKLTCASDIYSFGIVILQLLSGQKVIELDLDAREQLTRKAKDVSLGKRPLTDFEDPRLNGKVIREDFESILKVAVICVAKSSKGRPTIGVVCDEIEKAWKNTNAKTQMRGEATSLSTSLEVIPL